jgi:hypothetical protein
MAEWAVCPQCLLNHSRRASGICPRCGASLDFPAEAPARAPDAEPAVPPAPPTRPVPPPPPAFSAFAPPRPVSLGAKIAGAALLLNAFTIFLARSVGLRGDSIFAGNPASAFFDLALGAALLADRRSVLWLARLRAGLGAVVLPLFFAATGHGMIAALQFAYSIGLVLLLFGEPRRLRVAAGGSAVAASLGVVALGLYVTATGANPLGRILQIARLEPESISVVEGAAFPYHFRCPPGWYLVRRDVTRRTNPAVDRWATDPDRDLHVFVIAETLPRGAQLDMDAFVLAYLEGARRKSGSFEVAEPPKIESGVPRARFVHTRSEVNNVRIETYAGLFVSGRYAAQAIAVGPRKTFPRFEKELRRVLASFTLPSPDSILVLLSGPVGLRLPA